MSVILLLVSAIVITIIVVSVLFTYYVLEEWRKSNELNRSMEEKKEERVDKLFDE